jgi:hypothetical protein
MAEVVKLRESKLVRSAAPVCSVEPLEEEKKPEKRPEPKGKQSSLFEYSG